MPEKLRKDGKQDNIKHLWGMGFASLISMKAVICAEGV